MKDSRYGGFHLCGECGKAIKNGKFCKHEIPKIRAGDRDMKTEWRPDDWELPYKYDLHQEIKLRKMGVNEVFNAGASAMLSAVLVYLDDPCTEHPYSVFGSGNLSRMYSHRKDCHQCMTELGGEK